MRGKPKYKEGTKVKFLLMNEFKIGHIFIVDKYGTFADPTDVSYDIMCENENMLYKHIPERDIVKRYYNKNNKNNR